VRTELLTDGWVLPELDITAESLRLNNITPTNDMITRLVRALVQAYYDDWGSSMPIGEGLMNHGHRLANIRASYIKAPAAAQTWLIRSSDSPARQPIPLREVTRSLQVPGSETTWLQSAASRLLRQAGPVRPGAEIYFSQRRPSSSRCS